MSWIRQLMRTSYKYFSFQSCQRIPLLKSHQAWILSSDICCFLSLLLEPSSSETPVSLYLTSHLPAFCPWFIYVYCAVSVYFCSQFLQVSDNQHEDLHELSSEDFALKPMVLSRLAQSGLGLRINPVPPAINYPISLVNPWSPWLISAPHWTTDIAVSGFSTAFPSPRLTSELLIGLITH